MRHNKAFTLIELSLVLVIIGLLVGGVLVGQALIRAYQIRGVITEVTLYTRIMYQFRDKYNGLPGDIVNATNFWGAEDSCPDPVYTADPHTATCNGNGNGKIGQADGSGVDTPQEMYRAWQQLANADLLNGSYNGITGPGGAWHSLIGVNVPASRWPAAGYTLYYTYLPVETPTNWARSGHNVILGAETAASITQASAFTPLDVLDLDTKIDDRLPATGRVQVGKPLALPNCATSDDEAVALYNTAYEEAACFLQYVFD